MLDGTWQMIRGEQNGQEEPQEDIERSSLEIVGDQHTVTIGEAVLKGTHQLDSSQIPMTIDSTDTAGPFQGMSLKGIFTLEDDVFTVCFGTPDGERPTQFTTKDGAATILHVWKRRE